VSVVCCQVEVSATGWSLVQRSPTECGVSECDREASKNEAIWAPKGLSSHWGGGGRTSENVMSCICGRRSEIRGALCHVFEDAAVG
jgi:hypothetical protein